MEVAPSVLLFWGWHCIAVDPRQVWSTKREKFHSSRPGKTKHDDDQLRAAAQENVNFVRKSPQCKQGGIYWKINRNWIS